MAERPAVSVQALLGARLKLALQSRGAVLLRAGPGFGRAWTKVGEVAWEQDPSLDAAQLVLRCAPLFDGVKAAGLPLWVGLGASQVRVFVVEPPRNGARLADLQAAAAMRFQRLYGDLAADWALALDGRVDQAFVASALPHPRLEALRALAAAHRMPLAGVEPRFVTAWNQMRAKLAGPWLAVVDDGLLTLAATVAEPRAHLRALHAMRLPEQGADRRWLREQVGRVALREGVLPPTRVIGWRERPGEDPPTSIIDMPRLQLVGGEVEMPTAPRRTAAR